MRTPLRTRLGEIWNLVVYSLSGRLLLLTCLFVLLGEVLVFVPSTARHYRELLEDHILTAELAVMPSTELGQNSLPEKLNQEMLVHAGAYAVILKRADHRELYPPDSPPVRIDSVITLTLNSWIKDTGNSFACLFSGNGRTLLVISPTRIGNAQEVGVILNETPIRRALLDYCRRLIGVAMFISLLTAGLVFASLHFFLVRPMRRITRSMADFRENPEDAGRILEATRTGGEIGQAEHELAAMQRDLYSFLHQKARLAALGAAVARIQHDLRNILATAQLASDRLSASEDPVVKRLTPSLVASIDRAIGLATTTLQYGRVEEPPPQRSRFALAALTNEAAEAALASERSTKRFINEIADDLEICADREQMFRVILNLLRNAAQALAQREDGAITASARLAGQRIEIEIADNGPGIPQATVGKLFQPFALTSNGGSGLGLAIARELVRGHGGELKLATTSPAGTVFHVSLPVD